MPRNEMGTARPGLAPGPDDAQARLALRGEADARHIRVQHAHRAIDDEHADWQRIKRRGPDVYNVRIERKLCPKLQCTLEVRQQGFEGSSLTLGEGAGRGIPMKPDRCSFAQTYYTAEHVMSAIQPGEVRVILVAV